MRRGSASPPQASGRCNPLITNVLLIRSLTSAKMERGNWRNVCRKRILRKEPRDVVRRSAMSVARLYAQGARVQPRNLSAHLQRDRYGEFSLTDAVRPSVDLQVVPREGYRLERVREGKTVSRMLAAAVSRERL